MPLGTCGDHRVKEKELGIGPAQVPDSLIQREVVLMQDCCRILNGETGHGGYKQETVFIHAGSGSVDSYLKAEP